MVNILVEGVHGMTEQAKLASRLEAINALRSVLCDPDGNVVIRGSNEDRRIVAEALRALEAPDYENPKMLKADDVAPQKPLVNAMGNTLEASERPALAVGEPRQPGYNDTAFVPHEQNEMLFGWHVVTKEGHPSRNGFSYKYSADLVMCADVDWPNNAPHHAIALYAAPPAAESAAGPSDALSSLQEPGWASVQKILKLIPSLIEVARMPNIEHVADAHNAAVKEMRAMLAASPPAAQSGEGGGK